jgi:hypothetical protein
MGYLQSSGQESNIRWKSAPNQDDSGYQPPALSRAHASKPAKSAHGSSVRRQAVYPPSDRSLTAISDSLPVHERAASDISTFPEYTKPFGHLRSSMGRLNVQNSEGMTGRTPPTALDESTTEEPLEEDNENSGLRSDNTPSSAFIPETPSPLSIRSHIKAQLKAPDQHMNGMRIRCSQVLGPNNTSSATNRRTKRRGEHYLPATTMQMDNNVRIPENGNITSCIRHRKQVQAVGGPTTIPRYDKNSGRGYGSPARVLVYFHCCPSVKLSSLMPIQAVSARTKF